MKLSPESSKRAEGHRPGAVGTTGRQGREARTELDAPHRLPHPPCSPAAQTSCSRQTLQEGEGALGEGSRLRARPEAPSRRPTCRVALRPPQTAWGPVARPEGLMSRGWK